MADEKIKNELNDEELDKVVGGAEPTTAVDTAALDKKRIQKKHLTQDGHLDSPLGTMLGTGVTLPPI